MAGDEALVMTSLVLTMAIFLRRRRTFFRRMRPMALQTRKMRRNAVMLSIQQQNNINHRNSKTTILVWTPSCKPLPRSSMAGALQGKQGYIWIHLWSRWPSAYPAEHISPPSDHRGKAGDPCSSEVSYWEFVQNRLVNTIGRLIGMRLSLRAMRLAAALTRTSYTISRGSITWREFPVIKAT